MTAQVKDNNPNFFEKNKELLDQWTSYWRPSEPIEQKIKKEKAPPKTYEPRINWCQNGKDIKCDQKASFYIYSRASIRFEKFLCNDCWCKDSLFGISESLMDDGLQVFKIKETGGYELLKGRPLIKETKSNSKNNRKKETSNSDEKYPSEEKKMFEKDEKQFGNQKETNIAFTENPVLTSSDLALGKYPMGLKSLLPQSIVESASPASNSFTAASSSTTTSTMETVSDITDKILITPFPMIKKDRSKEFCVLFPGQGDQEVGMMHAVSHLPAVKDLFASAQTALGYDLADICLNGPKEKLNSTQYSQPALLVAGLASIEKLRADEKRKYMLDQCTATSGLSLGEYTALVFSEAISLSDAFRVVKARAEAMQEAAFNPPSNMLTVIGLEDDILEQLCKQAIQIVSQKDDDKEIDSNSYICEIANYLFPKGRVCAGHKKCIAELIPLVTTAGAAVVKLLSVSGGFHTSLMTSAQRKLEEALNTITIHLPKIAVYSNVTGQPYQSIEEIRKTLALQIIRPVQWEKTMHNLYDIGYNSGENFLVTGCQNTLAGMLKRFHSDLNHSLFISTQTEKITFPKKSTSTSLSSPPRTSKTTTTSPLKKKKQVGKNRK